MAKYNKERYYWIKLKQSLMTSKAVDFLMSQKDGANYVVLYQCLCLKTVNQDGELADRVGEIIVPFDENKIQRETKWFSIDTIRVAMALYKQLGLIYEQDNGILKIADFDDLVGSQTVSAYKKELQIKGRVEERVEFFPPRDKDNKRIESKREDIENNKKERKKESYINIINQYTGDDETIEAIWKFIQHYQARQGRYILNDELVNFLEWTQSHGLLFDGGVLAQLNDDGIARTLLKE